MALELANMQEMITFNISNSDIVNPTIIKTPYSNNVILPFSTENDKIFGYFSKTDKFITSVDFNPNERFPYQIRYNEQIIRSGYLQLNDVTKDGYSITLYDDLGAILRDMSETKLVDIFTKVPFKINKASVSNMMRLMPGSPLTDPLNSLRYLWWYSFIPSYQGLYDDFNSNKLEKDNNDIIEILEQDEHESRELRSYEQKPCIWYSKIISDIAKKYQINLDSDFHNEANPYWSKTVVVFNKLYSDKLPNDTTADIDTDIQFEKSTMIGPDMVLDYKTITPIELTPTQDEFGMLNGINIDLSKYPIGQLKIEYEFDLKIFCKAVPMYTGAYFKHFQLGPLYDGSISGSTKNYQTRIKTYIGGQNNKPSETVFALKNFEVDNDQSIYPVIIFETPNNTSTDNFPNVDLFSTGTYAKFVSAGNKNLSNSSKSSSYKIKGESIIINDGALKQVKVEVDYYRYSVQKNSAGLFKLENRPYGGYIMNSPDMELTYNVAGNIKINNVEKIRSNYIIDKDNIIPQHMDCGGIFLNHLKQYGLILYQDEFGDYNVSMRNTYFTKYNKVLNWNSKICNDLDVNIKPLNYDSKYYKLNHIPYNIKHIEDYNKRFGKEVEFGAVRIDTNYQFGELTPKSLQEGFFTQPIVSQEYGTYDLDNIKYFYRYDQALPSFSSIDETNKRTGVDFDYTIMFRDSYIITSDYQSNYPEELISKPNLFIISDDTPTQTYYNNYMWTYNYLPINGATLEGSVQHPYKNKLATNSNLSIYPYIRSITKDGNYSLDWGKPKQYYYEIGDSEYNKDGTLFNRFYAKWFKDRYDVNTKVLTAYFLLNQNDINEIKFNKFIFLYNNYWVIDKISEFKYGEIEPIQVTLIKVNDMNNYTNGQTII